MRGAVVRLVAACALWLFACSSPGGPTSATPTGPGEWLDGPPGATPKDEAAPTKQVPVETGPLPAPRRPSPLSDRGDTWLREFDPQVSVQKVVAVPAGGAWAVGRFRATVDLDPGPGTRSFQAVGDQDLFIARLDATGALAAATVHPGGEIFYARGCPDGGMVVTGGFDDSGRFDLVTTQAGSRGQFLAVFDPTGKVRWSRTTPEESYFSAVACAADGAVLVQGGHNGPRPFQLGPGHRVPGSGKDKSTMFVARYEADGQLTWSRAWRGNRPIFAMSPGLAVHRDGRVVVCGELTQRVDLHPGRPRVMHGRHQISGRPGLVDVFVLQLAANGDFQWVRSVRASRVVTCGSIGVDDRGGVYVAGEVRGRADLDPGRGTDWHDTKGAHLSYLLKLDDSGAHGWAGTYSGSALYAVTSLVVAGDRVIVAGAYGAIEPDLDPGPGRVTTVGGGAYISEFDRDGRLLLARKLTGFSRAFSLSTDARGRIHAMLLEFIGRGTSKTAVLRLGVDDDRARPRGATEALCGGVTTPCAVCGQFDGPACPAELGMTRLDGRGELYDSFPGASVATLDGTMVLTPRFRGTIAPVVDGAPRRLTAPGRQYMAAIVVTHADGSGWMYQLVAPGKKEREYATVMSVAADGAILVAYKGRMAPVHVPSVTRPADARRPLARAGASGYALFERDGRVRWALASEHFDSALWWSAPDGSFYLRGRMSDKKRLDVEPGPGRRWIRAPKGMGDFAPFLARIERDGKLAFVHTASEVLAMPTRQHSARHRDVGGAPVAGAAGSATGADDSIVVATRPWGSTGDTFVTVQRLDGQGRPLFKSEIPLLARGIANIREIQLAGDYIFAFGSFQGVTLPERPRGASSRRHGASSGGFVVKLSRSGELLALRFLPGYRHSSLVDRLARATGDVLILAPSSYISSLPETAQRKQPARADAFAVLRLDEQLRPAESSDILPLASQLPAKDPSRPSGYPYFFGYPDGSYGVLIRELKPSWYDPLRPAAERPQVRIVRFSADGRTRRDDVFGGPSRLLQPDVFAGADGSVTVPLRLSGFTDLDTGPGRMYVSGWSSIGLIVVRLPAVTAGADQE